jgi:hypothetical protein
VSAERETAYRPSEDVVAREIEGEIIIVPLVAGIGDADDELFTLNETARAVWDRLDGVKSAGDVAAELAQEYDGDPEEIEQDVLGLLGELLSRRMVTAA